MNSPVIIAASPIWQSKAELFSKALGSVCLSGEKPSQLLESASSLGTGLYLIVGERLRLDNKNGLVFEIDFDLDHINYRKKQVGKKNLLARALGIEKGITGVVDLSCGLARDAVLLSQLGFQVQAYERCAVLWSMLVEAQKLSTRAEVKTIQFIKENSLDVLSRLSQAELRKQSFYFDPMFPATKKDALPKKEMQIFRELVGPDLDSVDVAKRAAEVKVSRLVIKRPRKAEPLFEKPRYFLEGRLIRYDVYQF
ncbi:MAG: 16S rRNA methyltransferase [Candidatus Accumulibacter meliphilus]|jgi:16S rRNA (guanine1516-N2)-methyltransferase|uniref:16S rRNA methyltransferase n=1 Tax=Candidatus Accumulibacter meliphilus TaxID=2211374 RepID=A0A369XG36_9PROT|nr:MAG: 16S rRNA methyltransferase [Candidatus Accumulibacter meliphilus]